MEHLPETPSNPNNCPQQIEQINSQLLLFACLRSLSFRYLRISPTQAPSKLIFYKLRRASPRHTAAHATRPWSRCARLLPGRLAAILAPWLRTACRRVRLYLDVHVCSSSRAARGAGKLHALACVHCHVRQVCKIDDSRLIRKEQNALGTIPNHSVMARGRAAPGPGARHQHTRRVAPAHGLVAQRRVTVPCDDVSRAQPSSWRPLAPRSRSP